MRKRSVVSPEEAVANIIRYAESVTHSQALAARLSKHPSWYATTNSHGDWIFGPSKFVGYQGMESEEYLSAYDRRDGGDTEPALAAWFEGVDLDTALGAELLDAFARFAAGLGKAPHARWRVSVLKALRRNRGGSPGDGDLAGRIDFHPDICGGRPRISGTRIRVSDIVSALSVGETIAEILADFPNLQEADIFAALDYAARAVDHRVLRAA